jgi:hypothetical protein
MKLYNSEKKIYVYKKYFFANNRICILLNNKN